MTTDPERCNGVPVPESMTLEQFTQLVTAKTDIAGFLADPNILPTLETESDGYFAGWGPFMVQQMLSQTANDTRPVGARVRKFVADTTFVVEIVTDEMEAAAVQAVSNAADTVPLSERPKVESIHSLPATDSAPAQTKVVVSHEGSFIEIVEADVHAALEKVAAFFRSVGHVL